MHVKRLTLIGIAAIAAGYTFLSNAGPAAFAPRAAADVAAPGLAASGLATPGTATSGVAAPACIQDATQDTTQEAPASAPRRAHAQEEAARSGYRRVCPADLARFEVRSNLKPLPLVLAGLDFQPVDLADTPLARFTSLGGMAGTVGQTRSRLYRSFRMSDGHTLTLYEHDQSADGSGGGLDPQETSEQVNGLPARLEVLQAEAGKAVSVLSWREGRRAYQLWIDADVALDDARQQFLALAAALPKSVPAQPEAAAETPLVAAPPAPAREAAKPQALARGRGERGGA